MTIDEINGSNTGNAPINRFDDMSSQQFMEIMFAELTHQSPLDPQDSKALMEQINAMRSIESNITLMDQLGKLISQNEFASAGTLIGKYVQGIDEESSPVDGRVVAVRQEADQVIAMLEDGTRVPFENISSISETPLIL